MTTEIKLAYYRKSDWEKLMQSIVDRESMHDTWEEWHREYKRTRKNLQAYGCVVHEITIDVEALNRYCRKRGLKNEGGTRSHYVSQLPLTQKRKK